MEENFNKILEKIKDDTLDQEETKEYILAIKRVIKQAYENCKDEQTQEEIISDFLEEYEKDLAFRGKAQIVYDEMIKYLSYKGVIQAYKENKLKFDMMVAEAKKAEKLFGFENITMGTNLKKSIVSAIRVVIRRDKAIKDKDIIEAVQNEKDKLERELREHMTKILHFSISSLEEYGFIDEYIKSANDKLEEIGLTELKYLKRNPIPDEQYDGHGNLVYDVEDIGVLDTFLEENLENYSLEDMVFMTTFWVSKHFEERLGISKAMSTIKSLGLWDTILHQNDETILNIEPEQINTALKKDIAVTSICRSGTKITDKMRRQYRKFIQTKGLFSDAEIDDALEKEKPEIANLEDMTNDLLVLEALIVHLLNTKNVDIGEWGIFGLDGDEECNKQDGESEIITIAFENKKFRGPLLMNITDYTLKNFFGRNIELPKYKKEIDETYSNIMNDLYLPTNKFFINTINKAYEQNPKSKLLADLVGKKVEDEGEQR